MPNYSSGRKSKSTLKLILLVSLIAVGVAVYYDKVPDIGLPSSLPMLEPVSDKVSDAKPEQSKAVRSVIHEPEFVTSTKLKQTPASTPENSGVKAIRPPQISSQRGLIGRETRESQLYQSDLNLNEEVFASVESSTGLMYQSTKPNTFKKIGFDEALSGLDRCAWVSVASLKSQRTAQFFKLLNSLYSGGSSCQVLQLISDAPTTQRKGPYKEALDQLFSNLSKFGVRSRRVLDSYFMTPDLPEQVLVNLSTVLNEPKLNSVGLGDKPLLIFVQGGQVKNFWSSEVQDNLSEFANLLNHFHE